MPDHPQRSRTAPRRKESFPGDRPARLRVTNAAERALRGGHPWVFSDGVRSVDDGGASGLGVVYDRRNRFLALGWHDVDSPIRFRMLQRDQPRSLGAEFWDERLRAAMDRRDFLRGADTTAFRVINGESDRWPGFVLDRYEDVLVAKVYTWHWLARIDEWLPVLVHRFRPRAVVLRLSRNLEELALHRFERRDGEVIAGRLEGEVEFRENGILFRADVQRGQKTGFFLDQRENRRRVESLARGRRVLNLFSFTGGFSMYALRGGATSATDVDLSAHSLAGARRNLSRNEEAGIVPAGRWRGHQADVFRWLERAPAGAFDLVVVDPPSLARRAEEVTRAERAYARLTEGAVRCLSRGGLLVAASCSARVTAEAFEHAVSHGPRRVGRSFRIIERTGHAPDHPATFPEARYLKARYVELDG